MRKNIYIMQKDICQNIIYGCKPPEYWTVGEHKIKYCIFICGYIYINRYDMFIKYLFEQIWINMDNFHNQNVEKEMKASCRILYTFHGTNYIKFKTCK